MAPSLAPGGEWRKHMHKVALRKWRVQRVGNCVSRYYWQSGDKSAKRSRTGSVEGRR
jgi:hypothetical protein